jgi:hypothetical protein
MQNANWNTTRVSFLPRRSNRNILALIILWHVELLLGNDLEIIKYKTAATE